MSDKKARIQYWDNGKGIYYFAGDHRAYIKKGGTGYGIIRKNQEV